MRKYAWIYIIVSIIVAIWGVRYFMNKPVQTEVARMIEHENTISASAVLVRNEITYKTQSGGSLQPQVFDEARVAKGKKIATMYTQGIDSALKAELDSVSEKIAKLEATTSQNQIFGSDIMAIETRIKSGVSEVIEASISSDLSNLSVISQELNALVGTQKEISGAKSPRQTALKELYAKKREVEGRIDSSKKDIYSTGAGVYISGVDGCENFLTPDAVMNMSIEEFNSLSLPKRAEPKDKYEAGEEVCKTVDNGIWYVAACIKKDELGDMEKGDYVSVRIPELDTDKVDARVEFVSEQEGEYALVLISSKHYIKNVYSERCVNLDIIKNTYYGLKIPVSAIRVEDEQTGVFVNTDGVARFRKIDILYKNDEYAVVEKSAKEGYLRLYDPVITNGSGIEVGKLVN
ncbi:MAG: hypothetical protein E7410_05920 [Ruminococcaceae bacterium]|nr:hypothetical protein [Oscillospiraceae bacterium]